MSYDISLGSIRGCMQPRNVDVNGNIQIRFVNGSYIKTSARSLEVELPYEVKPASNYMTSAGASIGSFSADVGLKDLDKLIEKINEYVEPRRTSERDFWKSFMKMQEMSCKKWTEPAISFEETMGFNT